MAPDSAGQLSFYSLPLSSVSTAAFLLQKRPRMSFLLVGIFLTLLATCPAFQHLGSRSTDSTTALLSAIMANFSTTWTTGLALSRLAFHRCYFHNYPLDFVPALQTFSVPFVLSCLRNSIVFLQKYESGCSGRLLSHWTNAWAHTAPSVSKFPF